MSNNIIRCFHGKLSEDDNLEDLSGTELEELKEAIIQNYPDIDPALFNDAYWDAQRWHYTSLQTLLGDLTSDWTKKKFVYFTSYVPDTERVPYIGFSAKSEITSRGNLLHLKGELEIQITANSSEDNALAENISNRIILVLGSQGGFIQSRTVPNNLQYLTYILQEINSGQGEFDRITQKYTYAACMLNVS